MKVSANGNGHDSWVDFVAREVTPRLDLEQVYSHPSHRWQKAADRMRGGCPFHDSKSSTAFVVSYDTGEWYCAGCCRGGGPVQYLHQVRGGAGVSPKGEAFKAIVRELAERDGVTPPHKQPTAAEVEQARKRDARRAVLLTVYALAKEVYWSDAGAPAREYMAGRGFTDDDARDLELGIYPDQQAVRQRLKKAGYADDEVREAGVISAKMPGYVTFPWADELGHPLTLYGTWPDSKPPEGLPKKMALHNPKGEGAAAYEFTKRSPLYLDRARRAGIVDVELVEGLTDAGLLQCRGQRGTISPVANKLSREQVQTLARGRFRSVTICLDPDGGGATGTPSCVRMLAEAGITPYVAPWLPDGLDPDEFVARFGVERWREHIAQKVHGFRHMARELLAKHEPAGGWNDPARDAAVAEAVQFAADLPADCDEQLGRHYWPEVCEATGAIRDDMRERVRRERAKLGNGHATEPPHKAEVGDAATVPVFRSMADVQPEPIEWLWRHWIPRRAVSLLDGDPGLGKSTITIDLSARVSRGWEMPPAGGPCEGAEPEGVLLLSAEDDPARTIRPRLDAAGADVSRVTILEAVRVNGEERPPVLPWDLAMVEDTILDQGIGLVVVDPFMAYLDADIDAHKDQDVRRCLHHLKLIAGRTGAAILVVRHLNKLAGGPALYRGGGSIGILGAVRSALIVGNDPNDPNTRVLASNKSNLGPCPMSLTYSHSPVGFGDVSRIAWGGETVLTAADILNHTAGSNEKKTVLKQCMDAIAEAIPVDGMPSEELDQLCKALGHSDVTIRRAKQKLGVRALRMGGIGDQGVWRVYPAPARSEGQNGSG